MLRHDWIEVIRPHWRGAVFAVLTWVKVGSTLLAQLTLRATMGVSLYLYKNICLSSSCLDFCHTVISSRYFLARLFFESLFLQENKFTQQIKSSKT